MHDLSLIIIGVELCNIVAFKFVFLSHDYNLFYLFLGVIIKT